MRDIRVSGDASQDSESRNLSDPPNGTVVSTHSIFSDERDLPDELPEDEPLTPEMVEEEAVRGDFMLRWAAIFLAVLLGFTQINDTKPLVLIRSGDYMRAHGQLPPRTDVLSLTAADKPSPNVSWLFDHVVSLCWSAGGEKALTLLKVAIAGLVAYLLTQISIRGVPTWWNCICAVFAIVACSSDFVPLPELVTMLGMTITMRWLSQHRLGIASGLTWKLPLLIAVWCNFDPRAWIGAFVVVLYIFGEFVRQRIAARKSAASIEPESSTPWLIAGLSVVALLVNPFPGNSLLGPVTMYSIEYPAMKAQRRVDIPAAATSFDGRVDYYSVLNPSAIRLFDHSQIAGLALLLLGFVVLLLARTRRDLGFLCVLLGVTGLSLLAAHELPAAAIVAAVVAGISAQDWYRRGFNQQYTLDTKELLFSRGGRAVTVLALAGLAFCIVASRLPGAAALGWGFDSDTRATMDTFAAQIKDLDPAANILHTRLDQGDMLIWNGRKSFIDSRILPFGRPGDPNEQPKLAKSVFAKHSILLTTLFQPTPPPEDKSQDKAEQKKYEELMNAKMGVSEETLAEFRITHAIIRLAPPGPPDFRSVFNLTQTQQWVPISIEASAAILKRISPATPAAERAALAPNWTDKAFRSAAIAPSTLREFARAPNFYEKYVYRTRPTIDENMRLAINYSTLASLQPQSMEEAMSTIATSHLAIRQLNLALDRSPNDANAYRLLGFSYTRLAELEQMLGGPSLGTRFKRMRYLQAVMAYRQSLVTEPNDKVAWGELLSLYRQQNRIDLAGEAIDRLLPLLEDEYLDSPDPQIQALLSEQQGFRRDSRDRIRDNEKRLQEFLETQVPSEVEEDRVSQLVNLAFQIDNNGFGLAALKLLDDGPESVTRDPRGVVNRGQLMIEAGRLEEAHQTLAMMAEQARQQPEQIAGTDWQFASAMTQLPISDLTSAYDTWTSQLKDLDQVMAMQEPYMRSLMSLPFVADVNTMMNSPIPVWPTSHLSELSVGMSALPASRAEVLFLLALIRLEEANIESAQSFFKAVITQCGESNYRQLSVAYLAMLNDQTEVFISEYMISDFEPYDFPGEPDPPPVAPPRPSTSGE